ncbi:hypothetical protein B566_EDAN016419 [Ephemera danica]|nr:hypothetical protein B566_EDAN016419 [Ephemera danica]
MAIYQVYTSPILHRYKTTICSKATVLVTIIWLVTYISPFLLAYRSSGFWLKTDTYMEQPSVQFKHQFLLTASTGSLDSLLICSTFQELNEQMQKQTRLDVVGDLGLLQRSPLLPLRSINKRYNESVFGDPVSTRLQNEYSMWQPGRVRDEAFILSARLRVPGQRIEYQPGFWQVVKWAWLQYVALLCIVKTVTDKIKHWAFTNHVMPVIKLPPPWAKAF